jgi:hypothetical protein
MVIWISIDRPSKEPLLALIIIEIEIQGPDYIMRRTFIGFLW